MKVVLELLTKAVRHSEGEAGQDEAALEHWRGHQGDSLDRRSVLHQSTGEFWVVRQQEGVDV